LVGQRAPALISSSPSVLPLRLQRNGQIGIDDFFTAGHFDSRARGAALIVLLEMGLFDPHKGGVSSLTVRL